MTTEPINIVITERGARTVRRRIEQIGTGATAARGAVQLLRRALGGLGAALILRTAIRVLADFGQAMSTVQAVTQATGEEFKALREEAKRLGATTRFSATQVAEGMAFLARAGFDASETLGAVEGTLLLAQAGALDLGRAADIASNALSAFGLATSETGRVADVLALAANSANTTVDQLGEALKFVAPVARGLNISIEETVAALGKLGDSGIQASMAGTGLRLVMTKLLAAGAPLQAVVARLGLSMEDVNIRALGLNQVLANLREAGFGVEDSFKAFGRIGGTAGLVLVEAADGAALLNEKLDEATGTSKRISEIMDDNLNGALLAVKSAFEAVIIAAGDLGAESFLTEAFNKLADALRFVAANIDDVVAGLKVLAIGFLALKLPTLIRQFAGLAVAIALNPLAAFVTVVTLAVAGLTVFRDQLRLTTDGSVLLVDGLNAASEAIGNTLVTAVNDAGFSFIDFDDLMDTALLNLSRGLIVLLASANGTLKAIIAAFKNFPRALEELAIAAWNGFLTVMQDALNLYTQAVADALNFLGVEAKAFRFDFAALKAAGLEGGSTLGAAFKEGFNEVIEGTFTQAAKRRAEEAKKAAALAKAAAGTVPTAITAGGGGVTSPGTPLATGGATFKELLADLQQENQLLSANREMREQLATVLEFEDQLKRRLTKTEREQVEELSKANEALRIKNDLLDTILGPQETFTKNQEALNKLLEEGSITAEQFNQTLRDLQISFLDSQTDVLSGIERAFLKMQRSAEDFASIAESTITRAFSAGEDAIVKFVETGKFELDDFVNAVSAEITRLALQILKSQLLQLLFQTAGAGAGGGLEVAPGTAGALRGGSSTVPGGASSSGGGGGAAGIIGTLFSVFGALFGGGFGFTNGGRFTVGNDNSLRAFSGTDSQIVPIKARTGETVTVQTPGKVAERDNAGRRVETVNNVFNLNGPINGDSDDFGRTVQSIQRRAKAAVRLTRAVV